ncbi:TIGR04053 family radical SAM/SPASM domain-containing protein [Cytobacillus firmus]|uniref:TIGR04053 family radical SAM/SPASM domain-containing protein n=1 Tax=Cytobacillus firmus TaxID=1399 RepID=A0AA46Q0B7_CYTFI|nr:TIGR04053 family radical SAM/SPASM domain-containing protein [Cytobacillus firmus]KML35854.1 Fe-S oxidoreductase [Cytobacillus firmus]MCS0651849.1 TIGR04053 family radical SAM/SPASM domain-containing protein [Cytobacillus firmus]MCU1804944.1 TIGR04053 family radical SAM/SPASM domain-containing protein [Cytobacillus firmus]UYG96835.1 TIGR04053 family radical SAM/SPASM domain-containing protein [Cytobacillus firmus]WHY35471.1 TIGR04053 family radical SAM/SPASM domain-containing protein [Cytob
MGFDRDFNKDPFIVIWELTRACQLKCLHCRAEAQYRRDPRELSFEEGMALIDQIREMNNPMLVFTGGDPLMRQDVFDIAEYAVKKGVRVSMTPSATPNVTKEAIEKAKQVGLARWAFSLDGPNAEIHDHFRGTSGSYDLTIERIKYLHELEIPVQINTVISRYNIDYLEEMAQVVEELKCVLWSVFFLVPTGRGQEKDMISPVEHEKVFTWLYNLSKKVSFDIKTTAAQHYRRVVIQQKMKEAKDQNEDIQYLDALTQQGLTGSIDGLGRAPKGVNDGNGFVFISHVGDVYPSGLLPVKAGNVREQPLAEIYRESPIFKDLRNPDKYKGKCGQCEFRYVCGGSRSRAFAMTGDYMESEPFCVYIPKALRTKAEKA